MRSTDSLVKIGKWSDGEQWVTDRDGASEESEEVITRYDFLLVVDRHHSSKLYVALFHHNQW